MKRIIYLLLFIATLTANIKAQQNKSNEQLDKLIKIYLSEVNPDSIRSYMQGLQDFETRNQITSNHRDVAKWIKNKFISFGYTNAVLDSFYYVINSYYGYFSSWQYNVTATLDGSQKPYDYFVLGANYDSYVKGSTLANPNKPAPGADDNASGMAGIFEVARIMKKKGYQSNYSIQFVAFAAKRNIYDIGCVGSHCYVDKAVTANMNIKLMINLYKISYNIGATDWGILLHNYQGNEWLNALIDTVREKHTILKDIYYFVNPISSDAERFIDHGYAATMISEFSFNPNGDKITDVVANCNMDYCAEVVRLALGLLMQANETDSIIGINERINNTSTINIYPNPGNGLINIEINNRTNEHVNVEIAGISGQIVYSKQFLNSAYEQIDLRNYAKGMYFVKIQNNNTVKATKIIIQ